MQAYVGNIEEVTLGNTDYRRVLHTGQYTQLVVMTLQPGEEIDNEVHGLDQFIRVEQGTAKVILENGAKEHQLEDNWVVIIPAGTWHNVINTGEGELKLYTLYSPPEHQHGTVHATKADQVEEHFDGRTSE